MILYTAQYRYTCEDRLDITVKGKDPVGRIFAPSWKMVIGIKEGKVDWDEYSSMYHALMVDSYKENRVIWDEVLKRGKVTLVCFCKEGSQCHRYLLAEYFEKLGAMYQGER